jgi:thiamine transport system substrate-binding protein
VEVELAGLIKASKNKENAKLFLDFMLTKGFQKEIPLGNWMYPVINMPLPASYSICPKPDKIITCPVPTQADLDAWAAAMKQAGI